MMLSSIEWLLTWYTAQCNDEWEHQHGISIETLDNPGWALKIDLVGTSLQDTPMDEVSTGQVNHAGIEGNQEWLYCKVENNRFVGAGGPRSLVALCEIFRKWAERDH